MEARRGIAWMVLAVLLFVVTNTIAKYLAQSYEVPQVAWARVAFHMVFMVPLLGARLPRALATGRPGLQLLRSVLMACTTLMIFTTLHFMPLADASAVFYSSPILITAFSLPLLGERVGVRRWLSVAVGFAGALIVIRPGANVVQLAVVVPLGAACFQALFEIATRVLSRSERTLTTLVYTPLVGALVFTAAVPFFWTMPDFEGWALMVTLGLISVASQFALIKAYGAAPAATVAPLTYTGLIWAVVLGFMLFGHLPDGWTVLGGALITASGLYIFHREYIHRPTGPARHGPSAQP